MLAYFRINDPYRLAGLLALMAALSLPLFIDTPGITVPELKSFLTGERLSDGFALYHDTLDSTPPLAAWFYSFFEMIFGRSLTARHIVAFLILFLQSVYWGFVLIDKKVFNENTFIPSLLFSLLAFISFDSLALTGDLLAFGILLPALNNLIKEIEFRAPHDETAFNLGLFVSIASLFSFSYALFLPGVLLILSIFTRSSVRKFLLIILGFVLPHILLLCVYNLKGDAGALWNNFYLYNITFPAHDLMSFKSLLLLCSIPVFYLFVSLFILNRDARLTKYQSQVFQAMFLWFLTAIFHLFFTNDLRPQSLLVVIPPVSFFLTHFLLLIRRKKYSEMNVWILFVGIVTLAYLTRYEKIEAIDYQNVLVREPSLPGIQNKKIVVLSNDLSAFHNNKAGSGFYDWGLSEPVFKNPDYYENVVRVYRAFESEKPEVIIDPDNLMAAFFDRMPQTGSLYEKSPEGYRLKIANN